MNLDGEESPRFFASLRMTLHPVIARHDSAEAIWEGLLGNEIAALRSQ